MSDPSGGRGAGSGGPCLSDLLDAIAPISKASGVFRP